MTTPFQPKYDGLTLVSMLGDASEDYGLSPAKQRELIQELARAYRELLSDHTAETPTGRSRNITEAILNLQSAAACKMGKVNEIRVSGHTFDLIRAECRFMCRVVHLPDSVRSLELYSSAGAVTVTTEQP